MRAIAALLIVAYHIAVLSGAAGYGWARDFTYHLNVGVPIFFAISGFVLYRPFLAARHGAPGRSVGRYARNRFLRIAPAYWVAITLAAIYPQFSGIFTGDWWWYFGLLQAYSPPRALLGLPVAWTLCIEVSFYILLPFYAMAMARLAGTGRHWLRTELAVLGVLALASAFSWGVVGQLTTIVITFIWFTVGMALAALSVAGLRLRVRSELLWAAVIPAYALLCVLIRPDHAFSLGAVAGYAVVNVLSAVIAALVVIPAVLGGSGLAQRVLSWRWLSWLGLVSYGIYLYHLPVLRGAEKLGWNDLIPGQVVLSYAVVGIPVTIAFAAASFYLIERPALSLRLARRAPIPAPAAERAQV